MSYTIEELQKAAKEANMTLQEDFRMWVDSGQAYTHWLAQVLPAAIAKAQERDKPTKQWCWRARRFTNQCFGLAVSWAPDRFLIALPFLGIIWSKEEVAPDAPRNRKMQGLP